MGGQQRVHHHLQRALLQRVLHDRVGGQPAPGIHLAVQERGQLHVVPNQDRAPGSHQGDEHVGHADLARFVHQAKMVDTCPHSV
jgi:hypothetical protein